MGYWTGFITLVITLFIIWFMPKRLSKQEIYITWGWMACLTLITDLLFGATLDLYDFVESDITVADIILQVTLPPSIGVIFLNFIPKKTLHFIIFLIVVTFVSSLYEWVATETGYLIFKGWKWWYSIPVYPLGMIYLRWHLNFIRKR
ncbi:CBO0543 family protein [Paenibacillus sp. GD4]|uniref:CBO0543 family protein n=1 Tax=Paenibacillus sp. GD4 TaxID=3068890 RepID=UPI0027968486|nr:CBO0543 family protein [Paenibacillus sp. GD4]MDQ1913276.1 CBO0543 family protein [Paenibacillus sp. GD4]